MSCRSWLRSGVGILALVALAWACVVLVVGGFTIRFGSLRIGSRNATRALLLAVLFIVSYVRLSKPGQLGREAARVREALRASVGGTLRRRAATAGETLRRGVAYAAIAVSLFTLVIGIRYGAFVAGGSDSQGYVSEAELWEKGSLHVPQPLAPVLPWPNVMWTLTPLGYKPGTGSGDIVPMYPPGLPLLMAGFRKVLGSRGQYYVGPVLGALAVWLTFVLGRRLTGRPSVGFSAALVLAASPPFLHSLMLPMTDVPVAAVWTLGLVLALPGSVGAAAASGAVASLAVLIRPNLAPVSAAFILGLFWRSVRDCGLTWRMVAAPLVFVCGVLPGVFAVAAIHQNLYGSPWRSGHGGLRDLYHLTNLMVNVPRYTHWMLESGCAYILAGVASLVFWPRTVRSEYGLPTRVLVAGFVLVIWLSYMLWLPFQAWEWSYLRFLLSFWPVLIVLASALVADLLARTRWPGASAVLVTVGVLLFALGYRAAEAYGVFEIRTHEARYEQAAAYVNAHTPPDAAILSMQHSGSVRYYTGRVSIRYDLLDPSWLDRGVDALSRLGHDTFILLDDWEEPLFRQRFQSRNELGRLDWKPVAVISGVRLYDTRMATTRTGMSPPVAAGQPDRK